MPGNIFGNIFTITTFGESHGPAIGVVIDGCPAKIELTEKDIQKELDRRRPGQNALTTSRQEADQVHILSGVSGGKTLGTPIGLLIWNKDAKSSDYEKLKNTFRPSHADFTYEKKFGIHSYRGGGRASARETAVRVAAGSIAKKILHKKYKTEVVAYVKQIYDIIADIDPLKVKALNVEKSIVRCPDKKAEIKMKKLIEKVKKEGDTVGGVIECVTQNIPIGLGEPVFDRLEAILAKALLSLPATKGFEIGSGFSGCRMKGSKHNDAFIIKDGKIRTETNYSGGVLGGISNGEPLIFRVAFKPVSTIFKEQKTVTKDKQKTILKMEGRHDPCVLPRAVPIVEAMTYITLLDFILLQARNNEF
ncbi:chorismate synthase [Candidatus Peregrinibacteria bacterium]|nr:chorismate synthase [Candidatus Peregrinibacteria bacterium]